ncbi:hypothetical protein L3X38_017643 [Prunus dulcis]|uniref:Uncharacterized protein n=1 Tax=Prunus dulcis TaxID=3755 RepID=A0AAD4WA95_PRUDU|nr:hypothetical protein L3X38_017643 [Prunus dulcis]
MLKYPNEICFDITLYAVDTSDLTRVLATDASISFADLRCQLTDEGVQNADVSGDCKKNEDEDDFSFACTNPIADIFQNGQICLVFAIFNRDLLFADAEDDDYSRDKRATALSSSMRPPLKTLFFEERDTPTSGRSFYNLGGGLGS